MIVKLIWCVILLVLMIKKFFGVGLDIFNVNVIGWVVVFCSMIVLMIIIKVSGINSLVLVMLNFINLMVNREEIEVVIILCGVI